MKNKKFAVIRPIVMAITKQVKVTIGVDALDTKKCYGSCPFYVDDMLEQTCLRYGKVISAGKRCRKCLKEFGRPDKQKACGAVK